MTDYYWPQDIIPSRQDWRLLDPTALFTSPLSGSIRTVSRPGLRMGCTLTFESLSTSQRHQIMGLIGALVGRTHRVWLPDFSTAIRGAFPASELLTNTTFPTTANWTVNGAELTLQTASGRLRLVRTAATTNNYAFASFSTTPGAAYLVRSGILAGRGGVNIDLRLATTETGADIGSSGAVTASSYKHASGVAPGGGLYLTFQDIYTGKSADYFQSIDTPSGARCMLVNGASQTGSSINVDQLPNSTAGLLVAGDMIAIYTTRWEIKRVVQDLTSNSSGQGHLIFEPALRAVLSDNAPIAVYRPMAKFVLADESVEWSTRPGWYSDFQLNFVEDLN